MVKVLRVREVLGNTKYDQIIHMIESSQKMKSSLQEKADHLADKLIAKYEGVASRVVLYNALGGSDRFERYGEIARRLCLPTRRAPG